MIAAGSNHRSARLIAVVAGLVGAALAIATPLLPSSYTERMGTIKTYQGDESASTRLAVWAWTWDSPNRFHPSASVGHRAV